MTQTTQKPNILVIITDHQAFHGHDRPGTFDNKRPRFEQFAAAGARFDRAYSVCPICTPARASMMTGMYPSKHGLVWNCERVDNQNLGDFRQGQELYSHHLSKSGYRNAYVGKWHCGHTRLPVDYGIEGWSLPDYGKVYMSDAYRAYAERRGFGDARAKIEHHMEHPEWEGKEIVLHHPSPWHFMNGSGVLQGPPEAHEEQFVAHLAVEKMRELAGSGQPWSLVASFWGPHQPYYPSEPFASRIDPRSIPEYPTFRDDLAGRPLRHLFHRDYHHWDARRWRGNWPVWQEILARCYGQALQLDAAVGNVLDALDGLGLADNTLVIWVADHGDAAASHGGLWDKASTMTEEVCRIPLAIRWPAGIAEPRRIDRLVSNMDVNATLLDAAGIERPEGLDGRSLLPLCRAGSNPEWPDQLVCEHNGHGEDILQRMLLHDRYKYVAALGDGDEMYDLVDDPFEMKNLVDSPPHRDVKDGLRKRLVAHIRQTKDKRAERLAYALSHGY